jgi:parallel beta-helix repeat protein
MVAAVMALSAGEAFANHVQCGDTITQDTTLDSDLIDCPGNGITIGAKAIRLDLGGHTIDGIRSFGQNGVENVGFRDVVITNGGIQQFGASVQLTYTAGNLVSNLFLAHNEDWGVRVDSSTDTRIEDNIALDNRPAGGGIIAVNSPNTHIMRNSVLDSDDGIIVTNGSDNSIVDGNSTATIYLTGIDASGSQGLQVSNNTLIRDEIYTAGLRDSRISQNTVRGAAYGIIMINCFGNLIENNVLQDNHFAGIYVEDAGDNRIEENSISNNQHYGINVQRYSVNNVIERNSVSNSGSHGIAITTDVRDPIGTRVQDNLVFDNGSDGIFVYGHARDTLVQGNTATGNTDDGVDVDSPDTTLTENTARRNGDLGIEAVPGVTDGGGNRARNNGNRLQCLNVVCNQRHSLNEKSPDSDFFETTTDYVEIADR